MEGQTDITAALKVDLNRLWHSPSSGRHSCRRITWGKFENCGQTCIAPDYILCEPGIQDGVVQEIRKSMQEFYKDDPKAFPDYGRIINVSHFRRVMGLMAGCAVGVGGTNRCSTSMTDSKIMQEETFGPLLPIVTVNGVDEASRFINEREKPLALYVFSSSSKLIKRVITETSSGRLLANHCIMHYTISALLFGGVGNSGMGRYHGKHTFDQLSHLRGCLMKSLSKESVNGMRYPPHTLAKLRLARLITLGWPCSSGSP